mgnify:CR=1 FL=1
MGNSRAHFSIDLSSVGSNMWVSSLHCINLVLDPVLALCLSKSSIKKPMSAFIAGVSAPKGKRMGHAGAIISRNKAPAQSKIDALQSANIAVAPSPAKMGESMLAEMQKGYN